MPYAVVKQKCKQSDGDSGSWIVKRRDTGKKVSCHQSKEKAAEETGYATRTVERVIEKFREAIIRLDAD
jgi:hypothetical protein